LQRQLELPVLGSGTHSSSGPQAPPQTEAHPSLPHCLWVQLGVHRPVPQWFGPPAPQICPVSHPPQSMTVPQRLKISPHRSKQSAALFGAQLYASSTSGAAAPSRASGSEASSVVVKVGDVPHPCDAVTSTTSKTPRQAPSARSPIAPEDTPQI